MEKSLAAVWARCHPTTGQNCRENILSLLLSVLHITTHVWYLRLAPVSVVSCWVGFSSYSSHRCLLQMLSTCPDGNSVGEDIPDTIPIHPDLSLGGSRGLCRRRLQSAGAGWALAACPFWLKLNRLAVTPALRRLLCLSPQPDLICP